MYSSGDLEEGGAFMYGSGAELPGGDAVVPNGMKYLVDSMAANVQVNKFTAIPQNLLPHNP